ncbi:hypothetical protein RRSWK_02382 [Rhodopirellula sp. SWK7]|nr:hypothetical protein RRSWK_02382 [Rhodopirellula sp. SWK7]
MACFVLEKPPMTARIATLRRHRRLPHSRVAVRSDEQNARFSEMPGPWNRETTPTL